VQVPKEVATLLKQYAEFLESRQEYVVSEILRVAFRRRTQTTHDHTGITSSERGEGTRNRL
jgi:hypothetical protein